MTLEHDYNFLVIEQKFSRIAVGIKIRWGTADLEPYISELLNDTKGHTRQGFPKDIFDSLQALLLTHHKEFPGKRMKSNDIWNSTFGDFDSL
jgi:hypothetical protein